VQDREWLDSAAANVRSEAFNLLGNILLEQKQYDEAMARYDESIKLNPRNLHPYVNEAMAHHRRCCAWNRCSLCRGARPA